MNAPVRGVPYFTEFGLSLGWQSRTVVAMLWGYFDESGEDDPITGHLANMTIGGALRRSTSGNLFLSNGAALWITKACKFFTWPILNTIAGNLNGFYRMTNEIKKDTSIF